MSAAMPLTGSSVILTDIGCTLYRRFDVTGAPWRVMLSILRKYVAATSAADHPVASAVVDDFGTLVIVGGLAMSTPDTNFGWDDEECVSVREPEPVPWLALAAAVALVLAALAVVLA